MLLTSENMPEPYAQKLNDLLTSMDTEKVEMLENFLQTADTPQVQAVRERGGLDPYREVQIFDQCVAPHVAHTWSSTAQYVHCDTCNMGIVGVWTP